MTIFRAKRASLASKGYLPYSMAYRMTPLLQMSAICTPQPCLSSHRMILSCIWETKTVELAYKAARVGLCYLQMLISTLPINLR